MADIEGGLERPLPNQEKNSSLSRSNRLDRGRNRWGLILPLAGILGTATALAAGYMVDQQSSTQPSDNGHRTLYNPPARNLGIPSYITDQFKDMLGIRVARADSNIPSVYRAYLPNISRAPSPQEVDAEAITPAECPNLRVRSDMENSPNNVVDIVITKDTTVRLVGRVLVFPDQEQALDTAYNSTFYQDGLRTRLEQTTNFFNRFLPFKFEVEVIREPLMFPQPFQEIPNFRKISLPRFQTDRGDNMFLVDGFDEQQYSIAIFMITPNPDILFRNLRERSPSAGWVWRYPWASPPTRIAGFVSFPWHVLDERNFDYKHDSGGIYSEGRYNGMWAPEHEITHAFGIPHNLTNRRSIVYDGWTPDPDRAIIAKEDVQEKCFS